MWTDIPISQIQPAEWNYKMKGTEDVEATKAKIRAAIKKRGQIVNCIVRELTSQDDGLVTYEMVNGNHRLEVFHEEKVEKAHCFVLPKGTDQATAEMIALETNELNIEADPLGLGRVLKHIRDAGQPLEQMVETLPYTPVEVDNYVKALDFSWNDLQKKEPPTDQEPDPNTADPARKMVVLNLPTDLAVRFADLLKTWGTDAEAIEACVSHLSTLDRKTLR